MLAFEESSTEVIRAASGPLAAMLETGPVPQRQAAVARGEEPTEVIRAVGHAPGALPGPSPEPQRKAPAGPGRHMFVGGTNAPLDDGLADSGFSYERYTRLAGPVVRPPSDKSWYRCATPYRREKCLRCRP
jgi:hypothetical protein